MNALRNLILPRLKERSTYIGLVGLLAAFGVAIEPQYIEIAVMAGTGIAGIIGVIWPDK